MSEDADFESGLQHADLSKFDQAIIEDTGENTIQGVGRQTDADDLIRLSESQVKAILDYDRAVTRTWQGKKVVVEIYPDTPESAPVEIREVD